MIYVDLIALVDSRATGFWILFADCCIHSQQLTFMLFSFISFLWVPGDLRLYVTPKADLGCLYLFSGFGVCLGVFVLRKLSRSGLDGTSYRRRSRQWWLVLERASRKFSTTGCFVLPGMRCIDTRLWSLMSLDRHQCWAKEFDGIQTVRGWCKRSVLLQHHSCDSSVVTRVTGAIRRLIRQIRWNKQESSIESITRCCSIRLLFLIIQNFPCGAL